MRILLSLFLLFLFIVYFFLILPPLNAFAEDKIYTCKPVIAGYPKKDGKFYIEAEYQQESSPMLEVIPTSQILIQDKNVLYKNNPSRKFEILTPYKKLADFKVVQEMEDNFGSWDEILSVENFRTFYFRYKSDEGYSSLKRIKINEKNTRTSEITIPNDDYPVYFFLRKCVKETTEEPVQIDMPDEPGRKVS